MILLGRCVFQFGELSLEFISFERIGIMDTKKPLVSVVLPVYNRPSVINTINSILAQTYHNFELLIIDNASTDNTAEIISRIEDDRIKLVINNENRGQTYSINRGLELSKGKYIARIDADDLMTPERLEKQVKFMEDNPDYGLVGCWVQYITLDDKKAFAVRMPISDRSMRVMQTIACGMFHPAAMMRKSILDENKITYSPDIVMAEDYDMWRKIMAYSKAMNLPEVLTYYRKGDNDSVRHADIMQRECHYVRALVCETELKGTPDYEKMMSVVSIEDKEKKTVKEALFLWKFYNNYIDRKLDKGTLEHSVLKTHIRLKVYSDIAANNDAWYGKFLDRIYHGLRKIRYIVGR